PTPYSLRTATGSLEVSGDYRIYYQTGLENEASYLRQALADVIGHQLQVAEGLASGERAIQLLLETQPRHAEGYSLKISSAGVIITGSDAAGVFYGIQSLRSLIPLAAYQDKADAFSLPFVDVDDYPRFGFRGLHMDVSRNFQSKETILRILDLLSFYKVNRFLFYTTEDEGWRLEIDGLPELTTVGAQRRHTSGKETPVLHPAYGSGPFPDSKNNYGTGHYSRADFVEILQYARARHIKVIPELNFPGHARAAIKAMEARYERLMKEGQEEAANEYRLIDPDDRSEYLSAQAYTDNVVSVARESTFRFYEKVVDEIARMYSEAGLVMDEIHAGGDEVPEGAWTQSPMARTLMAQHPEIKDPKNLQAYFFRELLKRLKKRNLRVDGWEEVALLKNEQGGYDPNPEFAGQNVVPFIWNNLFDNQDLGYRFANAGYPVVLCNVSNFYFDLAYSKDPREPGLYWAGFVNTRDAWLFAPFDMLKTTLTTSMGRKVDVDKEYADKEKLKPEARKNILGLEAQLWSETIKGRDMIEYYMLPKLLGFAESAWARERAWETVADPQRREQLYNKEWNVFANTLGQKELQRLSYLQGGYNYRIAPPGAVIREGILHANSDFPGMIIRYTIDGTEPDENSPVWLKPVKVSGHVILKAFDASGRSSRPVALNASPER
ncbi:MAG: family 20 glycosylhydrolase, partial [Bacteroidota bacterium]|nr:family 20 glycosylhydrolase [Bacteroidota bacterium]